MGSTIDGFSFVAGSLRNRKSALRLAVAAGAAALRKSGLTADDVDLLVNAGLYRDGVLGEPALAPLIQKDLGANPEDPHPEGAGTFSFDVANGACGVLTALQVADGFLRSGTARTALVVASDADPGRGLARSFPFSPAGAAVVCRSADGERGLGEFRWNNDPAFGGTFRSTVRFENRSNLLAIVEEPDFARHAGEAAVGAALVLLQDSELASAGIDVVVASPARPAFTEVLCSGLGLPPERVVGHPAGLHTVGLLAAMGRADSEGRLAPGSTALLVCGGAGVTAGAALYRT